MALPRCSPFLAVALALATSVSAACISTGDDLGAGCDRAAVPDHDDATLVVEGDPWSGYAPFRDPALLEGTGYELLYVEQLCQQARADDLSDGRADLIVTTLDQFLLQRPHGVVVGVIDQSLGADALALDTVGFPYFRSLDDLPRLVEELRFEHRRPVLAFTGNSPSEMLLNELANTTEELDLRDLELVSVDQSATAYAMLQAREAQLAVIWAPDTSAATAAGYTLALTSGDVPNSIVDVIVVGDHLVERDAAAVRAVLGSFYGTMDAYLADPAELARFIADDGGLDLADAESVLAGVRLYGTDDANAYMNDDVFPLDQPQVEQSIDAIGSVLALLHSRIDPDRAAVDGTYLEELAGE